MVAIRAAQSELARFSAAMLELRTEFPAASATATPPPMHASSSSVAHSAAALPPTTLACTRPEGRKAYDRVAPLPAGWRRFKFTGDAKIGMRLKDGEGVLMLVNRKLRLKDIDFNPVNMTHGWYVEEVAGIPVRSMADFRAALSTVDRAAGEDYEIVLSEGASDGRTTVRDYRRLCNESPYESGRKRRPEHADQRISASMYLEVKKTGEAPAVPHEYERAVSLL